MLTAEQHRARNRGEVVHVDTLLLALDLLRPISQAGKGGAAKCSFFTPRFDEPATIVVKGWSAGASGADQGFTYHYTVSAQIAHQLISEELIRCERDREYKITSEGHARWCALR